MQGGVVFAALSGLCLVAWQAIERGGGRLGLAVAIGAVAGVSLYHAAFGFTGAWRRFARERRGAGLRAQMLLLALCIVVTFPMIASGTASGWVFPVGLASALGAMMFGVGMQLGGGCGSGTLFTAGGGSVRMVLTLAAFVAGSVVWVLTRDLWTAWPVFGRYSVVRDQGVGIALGGTLALMAGIAAVTIRGERRRHGALEARRETGSVLRGPWALWLGAVALAGVVVACFAVLGRPWGITSAFPLWGMTALDAVGVEVAGGPRRSVFADATSVMDFGIMLGALVAAGLAGRFAPSVRLTGRDVATAVIGGLMMGYGARLAFGCNIGGFLGGVVSGSLHGWWWLVFGYIGSLGGVWVRERIGMDEPVPV